MAAGLVKTMEDAYLITKPMAISVFVPTTIKGSTAKLVRNILLQLR